jgi:hypothetical protein
MFTRISATVSVILVAMTASVPAFAVDEKSPDECSKYLTEMSSALDELETLVPNIPPEEASYIDKEYSAAVKAGAGKRIYYIEHRPFFPAWYLRNAFNDAREQLKLSRPDGLDLKFKMLMASRIPYRMANAKISWDRFDNSEYGRALTLQQIERAAGMSERLIGTPGLYIGCLAGFIQQK